ncbi:hypothetical protein [Paraburkholderia caribensis]|uniref:hypothetical protein n=1 Tax=Paraburkholderia caribensis TaxID=75105 RepID=UPI0034D1E5F1
MLGHDEPKALILSTHGYRLTGTSFKALDSPINLWDFRHAFGVLPPNLVVYLSACWGAYPGAIAPIQAGTTPPYVVGPLVDIYPYDANELENGLLDLLASGPATLRGLYRLIRRYNEDTEMRREDYGSRRWLFGMQDQEGNFFPRPAIGNQLATRTEEPDEFVVRESVYAETTRDPVAREVEDSRGRRWQADIAALTPLDADGLTRLIG